MYGGSCPKCFGEIPGEEAATDPGEEVKARQEKSDNRRVLVRTLIPLILAVPVVGSMLLLAVGFIIWNRNPTVEVMNFDDDDFGIEHDIVSAPPELETPEPIAKAEPRTPRPTGSKSRPNPKSGNDGVADADPSRPPEVVVPKSGGLSFDGFGVEASRSGEVLSEPGQIFEMIRKSMSKQQATLKQCYDRRLKNNEDLQGRWRAKFVVNQKGYATNVKFTGVNMQDAELEACLAKTVARWKFSKIARPQPVEKSWKFRPN